MQQPDLVTYTVHLMFTRQYTGIWEQQQGRLNIIDADDMKENPR